MIQFLTFFFFFCSKYLNLKSEIDKLIKFKHEYKDEKLQVNSKDQNSATKINDINVKHIEDLSEKIRSLSQNRVSLLFYHLIILSSILLKD